MNGLGPGVNKYWAKYSTSYCSGVIMWISLLVVVQIGFTQSAFPVSETDGQVSVCTAISGAVLDRNIMVLLSTQDNTANCNEPSCIAWAILSTT